MHEAPLTKCWGLKKNISWGLKKNTEPKREPAGPPFRFPGERRKFLLGKAKLYKIPTIKKIFLFAPHYKKSCYKSIKGKFKSWYKSIKAKPKKGKSGKDIDKSPCFAQKTEGVERY